MRRRLTVILLSVATAAVGLPVLGAAPAQAIQAPVTFSSAATASYQTNGIAWAVASAQGKVFVGGTFTSVRPAGAAAGTGEVARTNFVVLDAATGAPTSCAPAFDIATSPGTGTVRALDVSPDGATLYVGGSFSTAGGLAKQYLAALDIASCTVVTSFTPLPNATVRAIDSSSTTVYYGGDITSVGGTARGFVAAATAVGQAGAGGLKPWAPVLGANVRALALKPDGSALVVGGNFDTAGGVTSNRLVVLDPTTGANLKTFTGFNTAGSAVKSIAVDATGFYLGNEGTGSGSFDGRTAYDWSGYTRRWQDTCLGATQAVVVHQGVLYSGSHAHDCSSMGEFPDGVRQHLLAQTVDNPTLLSWFPQTNDGLGESIGPRAMTVATASNGTVWMYVVGEFTTVNGVSQTGITRFGQGPDVTAPSLPVVSVTSFQPGKVRVAWRPSLDTDDSALTYQIFRDGSATPFWSGTVSAFFWNRQQQTVVDSGLAFGSTHTYRVTASNGTQTVSSATKSVTVASTSSTYATRVLQDSPTMLLRYDEGSDVLISDSSPNSNNVVLSGAATFAQPSAVAGDTSKSLTLTGTSSYLYGQTRFGAMSSFSLETWFRTTSTVGGKIIGLGNKQVLGSSAYDKHVYMTNAGRLVFGVYTGTTRTLTSPAAYNDGTWHHLAATQGASGMALYVDGVAVATNGVTANQNFNGYWHVGGDSISGTWPLKPSSIYWQGSLDETAVYPTALSAASVAAHVQAGTGTLPSSDVSAPTTPTGVVASYSSGVVLSWNASSDDVGVLGYDVYRSATSGFTPSGAPLVSTDGLGWTDTTAPPGTSYYVVVARDASGRTSAPSSQVSAAVPTGSSTVSVVATADVYANAGAPTTNFGTSTTLASRGTVGAISFLRFAVPAAPSGASVTGATLRWRTTTDVNAGSAVTHTVRLGPDSWSESTLTWNTKPATGTVVVGTVAAPTAVNTAYTTNLDATALGAGVPAAGGNVTLTMTSTGTDSLYFWSRETATAANRPTLVLTYGAASNDSTPPTQPGAVVATATSPNVGLSWGGSTDDSGTVTYRVHRSSTSGFTPTPSTQIASTGTTTYTDTTAPVGTSYYVVVAVDPTGNASTPSLEASATTTDVTAPSSPAGLGSSVAGTDVTLTWAASTDNVGVVSYDVHRGASAGFAPDGTTLLGSTATTGWTDPARPSGTTSYYRVVARDAAGNPSAPSGTLAVTVGDSTAPTQPTNLSASASGSTVTLAWSASSDNIAVTGYQVHRSATPGFAPFVSTLVATVPGLGYSDTGRAAGTWYYRVVAVDGSGNPSTPSAEASATVSSGSPTIVSVTPSADTYGNAGATSSNFGTSATLASRGTVGAVSYLRFVVPAAPAGKTLTAATLTFRTTTDVNAGSLEAHTVAVASNTWDELALTWANRPAILGPVAGTIAAGTLPNSAYTTVLDPAALAGLVGGQGTLSVTNTGTDSLYFWSSNYTGVSARPTLTLTFS